MDELTLLRRAHADVEGPTDAALTAGRTALQERIDAATRPAASASQRGARHSGAPAWRSCRARLIGGVGGGALVAAAIATVLVVTNSTGLLGGHGGAEPAAAAILDRAATLTVSTSDPVVPAGQYLLVDTKSVDAAMEGMGSTTVSYLTLEEDRLYIPADRSQDWIWWRPKSTVYQTFGPESEQVAHQWAAATGRENGGDAEVVVAKNGAFYGSSETSSATIASWPTDPAQLLGYIDKQTGHTGAEADGDALSWIAERLSLSEIPATTRASLYRAAALIPGVTITQQQATLDGRTGVAIGYTDTTHDDRQDIIIDPRTGAFIGQRTVLLTASAGMPAGAALEWSSVTISVVASAPGSAPDGGFDATGCIPQKQPGDYECPTR